MSSETLLYIILSGILALLVALFQYSYKSKQNSNLSLIFTFLRFLTIFSILLLLINPKFDQVKVYTEKPNLVLAIDNSNSIEHLNQKENALEFLKSIQSNSELAEKFDIDVFKFDAEISNSDTIQFNSKETDISNALNQLSEIYKNDVAPIVLISDGNQSFGNDYSVLNKNYKQPIYPIILGDTVTHTDLKIQQLNVNKYAFLKNKFPVEAILVYQGNKEVNTKFTINQGNRTVFSKTVQFSKTKNSTILNLTLPANRVGVSSYSANIEPLQSEKNTINNSQNFAVEVIDQKTKMALVSDFPHPDLGALKKSIESNEQRSVEIIDPYTILNQINDFQLVILHQPNIKFKSLYDVLKTENKNKFTIIGTKTDLSFLNNNVTEFQHDITNQTEDFQPKLNLNYAPFIVDDINFETFPPLKSNFGDVKFNVPFETILEKTVLGISNNQPLLVTFEVNSRREGLLLGENMWQWRAQSFLNEKSFNPFDDFIGKLIQYLASSKRKSRLNIDYESFYTGSTNIIIKAQLFDKNYEFDARQSLELVLVNSILKEKRTIPFVLKNNNYQVDLSGIEASTYNFTVRAKGESISKSGNFEVLEYNIEQQFLNADVTKLQQLATNTSGKSYFIGNTSNLVTDLINDKRFKPIQKSHKNTIPLIDWKYLLGLIVLTLSAEWFLRKYNGLI
ncbi:VWA domain-containing protein [Algibacter sp. 2305UL17-15]|uniref:VWA domain-containing protein n=1 Tax=Algibacter sp. 2305UL17-15 TaxID=3231268 RepID=UPI0034592C18